jgi:hypothetical protein
MDVILELGGFLVVGALCETSVCFFEPIPREDDWSPMIRKELNPSLL